MKTEFIIIAGPTASGKTSLAIELAKRYQTEILSFDSRQFYKELNIGTAKPTMEELAEVPHHFIGHISIHDEYNAGKYAKEFENKIQKLAEKYERIILVGGSGLYLNAIIRGFDELPDNTTEWRSQLNEIYIKDGIEALQNLLKQKDPVYYDTVDIHNPQRLIRALEISLSTGEPYSAFRKGNVKSLPFSYRLIGIDYDRSVLYNRINERVLQMMERGLLDEVKSLIKFRNINALKTVGYSELFDYLDGITDLDKAISLIQQHTRQYAKRQITWFKKYEEIAWIKPEMISSL